MNSHTPGPWTVKKEKQRFVGQRGPDAEIRGGDGGMIVVRLGRIITDRQEANSRLIAAAPDLLAALTDAVEALRECSAYLPANASVGASHAHAIVTADAAIAKATGHATATTP